MDYLFSYENYTKLLDIVKSRLKDYSEITPQSSNFVILRHDVEFSPKRALSLAQVEQNHGVCSTFFFQVSNNAYNILSQQNIERILAIHAMGHKIGLHFHLQASQGLDEIKDRIQRECNFISDVLHIQIDRFSFHRPSTLVLKNQLELPGLINAYAPLYFTYAEDLQSINFGEHVKYVADSRNRWNYLAPWDSPCRDFFDAYPRIQMLCHPYSWTETGYEIQENLKTLVSENKDEFVDTLRSETNFVKEYIHEL